MLCVWCNKATIKVNSYAPSNAIWRHRAWSTLVQVIDWCLAAPSHYLSQYWLIISKVLSHRLESNLTAIGHATILYEFEKYIFEVIATFSRGQWLNMLFWRNNQTVIISCGVGIPWMANDHIFIFFFSIAFTCIWFSASFRSPSSDSVLVIWYQAAECWRHNHVQTAFRRVNYPLAVSCVSW